MAKQILIKFTSDGAINQAQSSASNIRQGDADGEVSIVAEFANHTNSGYIAKAYFERPDGAKANVVMEASSSNQYQFVYKCMAAWFFAVAGQAKVTITITDGMGARSAQGTYAFAVEATSVSVDSPSNLTYDEEAALEGLIVAEAAARASADEAIGQTLQGHTTAISDINTSLAGKQDALTFDAAPTANSTNPVTSGGVKAALDSANARIDRLTDIVSDFRGKTTTPTTDSNVAYMKQVPATALNYAELSKVGGRSVVMNQLVQVASTRGTISAGSYSELATAKVNGYHKLLVIARVSSASLSGLKWRVVGKDASDNFKQVESAASVNAFMAELKNYDSTDGLYIRLVNTSESSASFSNASVMLIDLTIMFGAGNEPTAITDSDAKWLLSLGRIPYNVGTFIHGAVTKVVSKGFNLLDKSTFVKGRVDDGVIGYADGTDAMTITDDGVNFTTNDGYRGVASGLIEAKGNTTYCVHYSRNDDVSPYLDAYDGNGVWLSRCTMTTIAANETFTSITPANCKYVRLSFQKIVSGTTSISNISLSLSGSLNGAYKPYRAPSNYPIPQAVRELSGYGMGVSASVCNYIDFADKKYVKKVAQYAFQGGEWTATTANRFYSHSLSGMIKASTLNLIVPGLTAVSKSSVEIGDYQIGVDVDGTIYVHLTDSSTLADVESFFEGKTLVYELATPIETDVSESLPYDDYIEVEGGGSVTFENENDMGVPSEIDYLEEGE